MRNGCASAADQRAGAVLRGRVALNTETMLARRRRRRISAEGRRLDNVQRLLRLREQGGPFYGALDLGTNNCRLLIARPDGAGGFQVVDAFSRIVRLGEGLGRTGVLAESAQQRTLQALRICANKLRFWNVQRARLIATQACRKAANGSDFLQRVRNQLGLELEIIDAETEARLAVLGACPLIEPTARHVLVFDIGGGSTELMWLELNAQGQRRVLDWMSLPEGVVTVSERFGGDIIPPELYAAMRAHVRPALKHFAARLREKGAPPLPDHLLGTSGTVTTIAAVGLGLSRYDRRRVDGVWLTGKEVARISETLRAMSLQERMANGCIGTDRADLVVAGCAILQEVMNIWPAERIRVADRGLREGILMELMEEDGHVGPKAS